MASSLTLLVVPRSEKRTVWNKFLIIPGFIINEWKFIFTLCMQNWWMQQCCKFDVQAVGGACNPLTMPQVSVGTQSWHSMLQVSWIQTLSGLALPCYGTMCSGVSGCPLTPVYHPIGLILPASRVMPIPSKEKIYRGIQQTSCSQSMLWSIVCRELTSLYIVGIRYVLVFLMFILA